MITGHRKLNLQDLSNRGNEVSLEVNWNRSKAVKDCKYVRLRIGSREAVVSKDQLWALLFLISKEEQQEKMIPYRYELVKHHQTVVQMEARNDVRKGDKFWVPMTISVNPRTNQMSVKPR